MSQALWKFLQFFQLLLEAYIIFSLPLINSFSLQHASPAEKKVRETAGRRGVQFKKHKPGFAWKVSV